MEDDITYTSKANRKSALVKAATKVPGLKKESKPPAATIPNAFLRKVHFMEKYPQSLRDYIKKCFAQCTDDKSREIVSSKLMDTINSVSGQGNLNQHNWNARPLVTPVEKEPTPPPPPPPPPPPKEKFNQYPNRPAQAFSSTFLTQQQPPQMIQNQQSYNFQPTLQPPFGNYQFNQPQLPNNPLMPPPPLQNMMQPNYQIINNFQNNNFQNYQGQTQGRVSGQNSFQNYEFKPQTDQFRSNINKNNNSEFQYPNNQYQPKNTTFNNNFTNSNSYSQKKQELSSFAPGQAIPKGAQDQFQSQSAPSQKAQLNLSQNNQANKTTNNPINQTNNFSNNNTTNTNFGLNQLTTQTKGKKKKKNKKNKFNQQAQNQFPNSFNSDDESNPAPVSSSRQRILQLEEEDTRPIVGTSTNLEKQYLRLAGDQDIDPSMLRPLPILKESLRFCLNKYSQNDDYEYISEQLRSIRQDLSVQHIEDTFNVEVYETHAKLALLNKDWGNFNQSMGQLEILYSHKLGTFENICEFWKYRIIYLFGVDDIDGLCSFIPRINNNVIRSKDIQFALRIWKIAESGEWMKFFSIMKKANPHVASVMSLKAISLRAVALSCICRAVRPLTLQDYKTFLCFDDDEEDLLREFLVEYEIQVPEK